MAKRKKKKSESIPEYHQIYQKNKARKKKIVPGFWTKIETKLEVKAKLVKTQPSWTSFSPYLGKYITHDDGYIGDGYRALIKITVDDLKRTLFDHGIDEVLSACEKSLNSYKNKYGKKVLGDLVICRIEQEKMDEEVPYITCLVKTNRRQIPKFMGMSSNELKVF